MHVLKLTLNYFNENNSTLYLSFFFGTDISITNNISESFSQDQDVCYRNI